MKRFAFVSAAAAVMFTAGAAFAQADSTTPAPAAGAEAAPKARSAKSLECSKEADAKGIHGHKKRSTFMHACKKGEDTSKM
jgi:hypothetical protein